VKRGTFDFHFSGTGGGDALDNLHGSAAKRTLPQRVNGQRRRGGARCWRMGLLEQPRTEWKEFCSLPVSKKSEVADGHKAAWQQVEQEAAQDSSTGRVMSRFLLP
jgi:hypothetical protein